MKLCTPKFQRREVCGSKSPIPVTALVIGGPPSTPHRANDRLIDEDLVASVGDEQADLKLSTEHRRCKHVAWDAQQQVVLHADVNVQSRGYLGRHTRNRDLAGDGNVAAAL